MTTLSKPVRRVTSATLDGSFGPDRNRKVIITLVPGNGRDIPDTIQLRPQRTRRAETIAVMDVYRFALRARVNLLTLAKARERKSKKAERLARARQERAEKRLFT